MLKMALYQYLRLILAKKATIIKIYIKKDESRYLQDYEV